MSQLPVYRDTGDRERLAAVPRWFLLRLLRIARQAAGDGSG